MLLQKEATMVISKELLDELLKSCERPEDQLCRSGLMERLLFAELTEHLGYEKDKDAPADQPNCDNSSSSKVLKGQGCALPISISCDRDSSFDPKLGRKDRLGSIGWMTGSSGSIWQPDSARHPRPS